MESIKWILNSRQRCDLEMLLTGSFSPLTEFLSQADYESVLSHNRLPMASSGLCPLPLMSAMNSWQNNAEMIALCDIDNSQLASMKITDKWKPNKVSEAKAVFGTEDSKHPGVDYLLNKSGNWYLGGSVHLVQLPNYYDFVTLRHTPASLRQFFAEMGYQNIVGFQTRNPIHRAHMELTLRAAEEINGHILIHPVVGMTKHGDIDYFTRVRCYQKIMHYYPPQKATLSLLPLAMRMGGPKEALWHALIRKNYGCTHFIVGRDHAGPGNDSSGKPFYDPYAAQEIIKQYQDEIGIKMLPFQEMVYVKERKQYCLTTELKPQETALQISGTELRNALLTERDIPEWFSFPEIINELRKSSPPKHKQGFSLFFTGLSGAGKTTLARALMSKLMAEGIRNITLLDGDVTRRILTGELGFSKADRDLNIHRIGFVAAEVTKTGGIALCAAIAPYADARIENRQLISQYGGYIEVYTSTSLSVCEERDTKGLYAKARNGELKGLTGVDDPYEPPQDAEIIIDTSKMSIEESVNKIIHFLQDGGYIKLSPHFTLVSDNKDEIPYITEYA